MAAFRAASSGILLAASYLAFTTSDGRLADVSTDPMRLVQVARWKLRCDPEATRRAFSDVSVGSPERCGCEHCLNFADARNQAYPPEALAIFEQLGIDSCKESEIWHTHRDEFGLHHYGGFFHLVGVIESGKDAIQIVGGHGTFDLESIGNDFEFGFTSNTDAPAAPGPFKGNAVLRLEFQTKVPWLLDSPEPE